MKLSDIVSQVYVQCEVCGVLFSTDVIQVIRKTPLSAGGNPHEFYHHACFEKRVEEWEKKSKK